MAKLKKCKDCGNQISKKAKACPQCGAPNSASLSKPFIIFLIIIGLLICMISCGQNLVDDAMQRQEIQKKGKVNKVIIKPISEPIQLTKIQQQNHLEKERKIFEKASLLANNGKKDEAAQLLQDNITPKSNLYSDSLRLIAQYQGTIPIKNVGNTLKPDNSIYDNKTQQFLWVENGKEAAAAKLKEPNSAEFRNVSFNKSNLQGKIIPVVCGEINGRNSYGGYSGFQRFVSTGKTMTIFQNEMDYNEFVKVWNQLCTG